MEEEVAYKNNPTIESKKRLNMAYSLIKNPQIVETITESKGYFFHGTNSNALPYILKYGINSLDTSVEKNIVVNTGEQWSRIQGKRDFVSITDCLDVALRYANMESNGNVNDLLDFGVVIGTSLEHMEGINTIPIHSGISEIGVIGNIPLNHIKFLAVPDDKVEFVRKMVGSKNIEVISMNIKDRFYDMNFPEKLNFLEYEKSEKEKPYYQTYTQNDVKPMVDRRRFSKIKEIFEDIKQRMHGNTKEIKERG